MIRLTAAAVAAVLLQASSSLAGGLKSDLAIDVPQANIIKSADDGVYRTANPSLSSSEIAAIQYHEPLSFRCQTREGIFPVSPERPIDTPCVVNGLPGFMLP